MPPANTQPSQMISFISPTASLSLVEGQLAVVASTTANGKTVYQAFSQTQLQTQLALATSLVTQLNAALALIPAPTE